MQQIAAKLSNGSFGNDMLVNHVVTPSCVCPVKEPHVPVGVAFAVAQPSSEKTVAPCHCISGVARLGQRSAYRGCKVT